MKPSRDSFDDLAAKIDDGQPIDWEAEARRAHDAESQSLVRGLKTLSEVAAWLRSPVPADEPAPEQAGTPWGDLDVFEVIGRGAFGTVHRATDKLGRDLALKLLDPDVDADRLRARIFAEACFLARVRHPNIVLVHDAGESDGRAGLWMERIEGRTLAAEVDADGPMSAEEAVVIGRRLCDALIAIHAEGYVHADVKAQNVMRERGGRIVLMDFGAGQALADADSNRLAGTPLYLAPERLAGGPITASADIYSLGVLLYYLVTGTYPVDGETRDQIAQAHRDSRRTRLRDRRPGLPDAFVAAVEAAIEPDATHRHPTAGVFEAALAKVVAPSAPSVGKVLPGPSSFARPQRWLMPLLAGVALATSGVALTWHLRDQTPVGSGEIAPRPPTTDRPSPGAYLAQANFYRVTAHGRQPITPGATVRPGDVLELDMRLSQRADVFVVNEDDTGAAYLLFPLPDGNLQNPLAAGLVHTLPGPRGQLPVQWEIDAKGRREAFYVIVNAGAEPAVRQALARLNRASDSPSEPMTARNDFARGTMRGASNLAHVEVGSKERDRPWRKLGRPLQTTEESVSGMWVRELALVKSPTDR